MTTQDQVYLSGRSRFPSSTIVPILIILVALYPALSTDPGPHHCVAGTAIVLGLLWLILGQRRCTRRDFNKVVERQVRRITYEVIAEFDAEWDPEWSDIIRQALEDPDAWKPR